MKARVGREGTLYGYVEVDRDGNVAYSGARAFAVQLTVEAVADSVKRPIDVSLVRDMPNILHGRQWAEIVES